MFYPQLLRILLPPQVPVERDRVTAVTAPTTLILIAPAPVALPNIIPAPAPALVLALARPLGPLLIALPLLDPIRFTIGSCFIEQLDLSLMNIAYNFCAALY